MKFIFVFAMVDAWWLMVFDGWWQYRLKQIVHFLHCVVVVFVGGVQHTHDNDIHHPAPLLQLHSAFFDGFCNAHLSGDES